MSAHTCQRYSTWIPLYRASTLELVDVQRLEAHLRRCALCRADLAAQDAVQLAVQTQPGVDAPPQLTERILGRIACYEAARPASRVAPHVELRAFGRAPNRFVLAWRYSLVAAVLTVAYALLRPVAWATFMDAVARNLNDLMTILIAPGPDEISWGVWILGVGVLLFVVLRFWRADASVAWRRELSERLPQLW